MITKLESVDQERIDTEEWTSRITLIALGERNRRFSFWLEWRDTSTEGPGGRRRGDGTEEGKEKTDS